LRRRPRRSRGARRWPPAGGEPERRKRTHRDARTCCDAGRRAPGRSASGRRLRRCRPAPDHGPGVIDLLLVDDQALVRTGMRLILNAEPDLRVTGEAGDGEEAVIEAERVRPDVVLMDIRMPKVDGIAATRAILA